MSDSEAIKAIEEHLEVTGGVLLGHTAVISAIVSMLRDKGIFDQNDMNTLFDLALVGAENATVITPETNAQARQFVETMAGQFTSGPKR